jgi:peptidoglycan/xylan/chitin deacetylase (PgdA/CDA1 family)
MHLRAVWTSIVIILLLTMLFAGLETSQATAAIGYGPLASTFNIRGTEVSLEANPNSSLHAAGTTDTIQGSNASTSVAGDAKKYVIFRDDDISARSLNTLQAINQVHIDENVPVTLAVIPHPNANGTGNELLTEPLYSYLRSIQGNPLFEFAQHGYDHVNYVANASDSPVQEGLVPARPYADLDGSPNRSEFRERPYEDQYTAIKQGRDDLRAAFGVTPTTFVPPFNTGDNNTLKALNALRFTLYSTSLADFHVQAENLQGITVQGETFGLGWKNDTLWKWRVQNLTKYTDAALDAAAPGDSIVIYYHYWTFNKQDGSPDLANIGLLKQYIEHLKNRGDVLFTTLGGQQVLKASSAPAVCAQDANNLDVFARTAYNTYWHNRWNSTKGWSYWEPLGGMLIASPASIALTSDTIDVFMRGSEGTIRQMHYNGTEWSQISGFLAFDTGPRTCLGR